MVTFLESVLYVNNDGSIVKQVTQQSQVGVCVAYLQISADDITRKRCHFKKRKIAEFLITHLSHLN